MTKAYLDLAYVQSDSKGPTLLLDVAKEVDTNRSKPRQECCSDGACGECCENRLSR